MLKSARMDFMALATARRCAEWLQMREFLRQKYNYPELLRFEFYAWDPPRCDGFWHDGMWHGTYDWAKHARLQSNMEGPP